ncbi:MAG: deoxyguanosinetriphosphate triphosphohydrolase [Reichenbachiella sp.]
MNWLQLLSSKRLGDAKNNLSSDTVRSEFEADYDRIIFSRPFRNLQDKTQVFPLPDQDFVHTRLTHSLEVSSVGRSLGKSVGQKLIDQYPELEDYTPSDFGAIVGAAALAHDVGNPPFGHSGETAISDFFKFNPKAEKIRNVVTDNEWEDLINFEGNAQGFRLLTRNQRQGLKLTLSTLAAFTKYPCPSFFESRDKSRKSQKKYGFFRSEEVLFEEMAEQVGLIKQSSDEKVWSRHPLTFLVEAADDICYSIIDLEDAFGLGLVSYIEARDFLGRILKEKYQPEKLNKIPSEKEKIGVLRAVAISVLIGESANVFMENEQAILFGDFDKALTDLVPSADVLKEIGTFSVQKIYQSRQVLEKEAAGFEVIDGLLTAFATAVFDKFYDNINFSGRGRSIYQLLPEDLKFKLENQRNTPYESSLLICDYISGMTDSSALKQFKIIKGIHVQ